MSPRSPSRAADGKPDRAPDLAPDPAPDRATTFATQRDGPGGANHTARPPADAAADPATDPAVDPAVERAVERTVAPAVAPAVTPAVDPLPATAPATEPVPIPRPNAAFFYGSLCHLPLLRAVLGRPVAVRPARLPGMRAVQALGTSFAMLVPAPGAAAAAGIVLEGLGAQDWARLDAYEAGFVATPATVLSQTGPVEVLIYHAATGLWREGPAWDLDAWAKTFGPVAVAAAPVFLRQCQNLGASRALARYPQILAAATARVRAARPAPAALRRSARPGDVRVQSIGDGYAGFFAVEDYLLRHRRFDGSMTPPLSRAVLVSCDAAVVLPWDPWRDEVLVIEQFRVGPFARGDANPWLIEAIAGRVDAGETPETCAHREAMEEAGLALRALVAMPAHYPSPGAKSEYVHPFIAIADLAAPRADAGGLGDEGEDIRAHVLPRARLMALIEAGEPVAGPLLACALWLQLHHPRLQLEFAPTAP